MLQSPNELGPRAALLQHYNVVKQHTEQSKYRVSCKGCSHTFAGKTTRMAAHYMQTAGESGEGEDDPDSEESDFE